MSLNEAMTRNFFSSLISPGRAAEISESDDVYGWLVGSWDLRVLTYKGMDLSSKNLNGEVHFSWVLEGRAIQDVWIMPPISDRKANSDRINNMYGTTLRIWDPKIQAWRIRWMNPVSGHEERQTGRRIKNDIVQVGARADGTATRWRYTEITPNSFHWIGEVLEHDGDRWRIEGEFHASRQR